MEEIFRTYLKAGSVRSLKQVLDQRGLVTKARPRQNGEVHGAKSFSRGLLYRLLANPIYRGKLPHKGLVHEGRHAAIVDETLWNEVQALLKENRQGTRQSNSKSLGLLAGPLFTADGERLVPSHAVKAGRRYRYYIERRLTRDEGVGTKGVHYAAQEVEVAVIEYLNKTLTDALDMANRLGATNQTPSAVQQLQKSAIRISHELLDASSARPLLLKIVSKITLGDERLVLELKARDLAEALGVNVTPEQETITIETLCHVVRRGQEQRLVLPAHQSTGPGPNLDPVLIRAVADAHHWWIWVLEGRVTSLREIVARTQLDPPRSRAGCVSPFWHRISPAVFWPGLSRPIAPWNGSSARLICRSPGASRSNCSVNASFPYVPSCRQLAQRRLADIPASLDAL